MAIAADQRVKRIEGFHLVELIGPEKTLTERQHTEIDETVMQRRAA
jgi:hypothetical protein